MAKLPQPKNKAIDAAEAVLEKLIEGAGVDVVISAGTSAWPFLASPIIRQIFKYIVEQLGEAINAHIFKFAIKIIIRIQSTSRKEEFNKSIQPIIAENATNEEVEKARADAIRLIERNR